MTVADNETAEQETVRPGGRRDLPGWIATPLVTLVLAPALAISIGVLMAESSMTYPKICAAAAATNSCQETIYAMIAVHARIFLAGWLLLWALPWWRGLRPYRIGAAVAVAAVLLAVPFRLVNAPSLADLFSMGHWDRVIHDPARTPAEASQLSVAFAVTALLVVALPAAGVLWFAATGRPRAAAVCVVLTIVLMWPGYNLARLSSHAHYQAQRLQLVEDTSPPCQVHSGSQDVCPGG